MYKANIFAVCGLRIMLYCKQTYNSIFTLRTPSPIGLPLKTNRPTTHLFNPTPFFSAMLCLCYLISFCHWPRGYKHVHWTWSYPRIRVIILAVKQHNSSQVPPPCQGSRHARVIDFFISEIRDQLLTFNLGWLCSGVKNNERLSGIQWPIIETLRTSTLQMTSFDMMRTQVWKERWKLNKNIWYLNKNIVPTTSCRMFPGRAGGCSHEMASANIEMPRLLAPDNCVFHSDLWSPHFIGDPGHEALDTGH